MASLSLRVIFGFWCTTWAWRQIEGINAATFEGPNFSEEPPSFVQFFSDQGLLLNCSFTGNPMPSVQWRCGSTTPCSTISGLRLLHDSTLTLLPFSRDTFRPEIHDRTYRCVGVNSVGTLVKDVAVKGVVPLDKIEPRVPFVPAKADGPAVFECQYPDTLAEVNAWIRDDVYKVYTNTPSDKYLILPNGSLLIWQVSSIDFYSKFQCQIRNKFGSHDIHLSSEGRLRHPKLGRPIIPTPLPLRLSINEGLQLVLPCLALGNPKPRVQWYRRQVGGQFLPLSTVFDYNGESSAKVQIRQGVLLIPSVRPVHAGTYSCNATNLLGSVGHQVELVVQSMLELSLQPSVLTVELGKTSEFTCTCSDPTADLEWFKDGEEVKPGSFSGRLRLSKHKLQLSRVSKEDQGMYQCIAKRGESKVEQKSSELRLGDLKPMLLYTFIDQTVLPGTVLSVRCKGTGWPLPTVTWTLDGFDLPLSERFTIDQFVSEDVVSSYINITGVVTSDAGEYTCTFRNVAGETAHSNRINVYGDLLIRPMPETIAVFGKPFRIKCPVGGWPIDKITWSKDRALLPSSVHQKVSADGILVLEGVTKQHGGIYKCFATRQAQTVEGTVEVTVVVLPAITPFQFGNAVAGERVSVLCSLTTTDLTDVNITWNKDGHSLTSATSIHKHAFKVTDIDEFTSSLSIRELRTDLDGNYTCRVTSTTHTHIEANWTSSLRVNVPPRITKFNFEEQIVEGMKVQALCFSQGDLPLSFKWFRDSSPLISSDSTNGFSITSFGTNSEILTIDSVRVEMGGVISCQVSNRAGNALHSAVLMIKVPPKFTVEPADTSVPIGSRVTINCEAEGRPTPKVKWLQEVRSSAHENYRDVDTLTGVRNVNGNLTFLQITKDHAGFFVCQATNDMGPPLSKRIQISVNAPPKILPRSTKEVVEIGQDVTLRCVAEGDQPIQIIWRLNGADLISTESNNDSSKLQVKSVRLTDRGDYACFAVNPFGHDYFAISLLVQELPLSPNNFRVLQQSSRAITLAWSIVAYIDTEVVEFIMRHKSSSEEKWNAEIVNGDESSRTVKNLLPFTIYAFTISARNQIGTSQPSQTITVMTSEEPPSAPRHLTVEQLPNTIALRVSWVRPEFPNGFITHYNVMYQQISNSYTSRGEKYRNVPWSRSSLTLRVEPAAQYSITVRPVNSAGMGGNSTVIQVQTREGVPRFSPEEVTCEGISSKSLQISWKPPPAPHKGLLIGFRVNLNLWQGKGVTGGPSTELESEVLGTSTVVQGLKDLTLYSVQVAAFTAEGSGPPSRAFLCATKESLPVAPPELKVVEQLGYVVLAWSYDPRLNESLRRFHIYVRTRDDGQILKKAVPAKARKYELRHLGRDQLYEACVTAENGVGEGSPSRVALFKIPQLDIESVPPTILTYGERLTVPWKTNVALECQFTTTAVNVKVAWKKNGIVIPSAGEDMLELRGIKGHDSANYTCEVSDGVNMDHIVHTVYVQVPPDIPVLHARKVSVNGSTFVHWTATAGLLGFSLNYRTLDGEWEEVNVDKKQTSYEFRLFASDCFGKTYETYVTAYNEIGASITSDTVRVDVEGHFNFPPYASLFTHNSTSVTFNFSTLPLFECENAFMTLEYKGVDDSQWVLGHSTNWTDAVTLDLKGHPEYQFRLKVQSGQNFKSEEFKVSLSQAMSVDHQTLLGGVYREALIVVPLTFAIVAILAGFVATMVFCWRRGKEKKATETLSLGGNSFSLHEKAERDYTIIRETYTKGSDCASAAETDDDIHPYATFHMKSNVAPECDFYYNPSRQIFPPAGGDYSTYDRHTRQAPRREHEYMEDFGPDCFHSGVPETFSKIGTLVTDRRSSLPRTRHRRSGDTEERRASSSNTGAKAGAHVSRSMKRRRRDDDAYMCPHDHAFINV